VNDNALAEQAIVIDGTSYLPVRAVAEALNMDVGFENNNVILKSINSPVANQGGGPQFDLTAGLAQILGMTSEELQSALKAGTTLEQLAGNKNITIDQLKEQLLAKIKPQNMSRA